MDSEKLNNLKNNAFKNETPLVIKDKSLKLEEPKKKDEENDEALFDSLIEQIGNDGKFQNRINYLYNLVFVMLITLPFSNYILAMTVPDHWCHVPGREFTNYTAEDWKEKWLPKYVFLIFFFVLEQRDFLHNLFEDVFIYYLS